MAALIFVVLLALGIYNLIGFSEALASAGMWLVAAVIAFVMGPKYPTGRKG